MRGEIRLKNGSCPHPFRSSSDSLGFNLRDYPYASPTMAERLERCEVLAPPKCPSPSDHFPIMATFRSYGVRALRGSTEEAQFRALEPPSNGHRKTHEDVHEPALD